jgi:Uma2 family endonuclease
MTTQLDPIDLGRTYTLDEFMALPDEGNRYELVKGELVKMSQPGDRHGRVSGEIYGHLWQYVRQTGVGRVWAATGFVIDPTTPKPTVRAPDVAFVVASRVPQVQQKAVPVVPDLAVEVVSPTDIWDDVEAKIAEYLQAGVRLIWIIPPRSNLVEIYRLGKPTPSVLGRDDELDGGDVIPGFKLSVKALFE